MSNSVITSDFNARELKSDNYNGFFSCAEYEAIRKAVGNHLRQGILDHIGPYPNRPDILAGYGGESKNALIFWVERMQPPQKPPNELHPEKSREKEALYEVYILHKFHHSHIKTLEDACRMLRVQMQAAHPCKQSHFSLV